MKKKQFHSRPSGFDSTPSNPLIHPTHRCSRLLDIQPFNQFNRVDSRDKSRKAETTGETSKAPCPARDLFPLLTTVPALDPPKLHWT